MVDATLPVGGSVNSGACLLCSPSTEQLNLAKICDGNKFALEVSDDSMLDAHIRSGDMLVIRRQPVARHGQLAIVRTGDSETCLRFWLNEGSRVRLQPATRLLAPTIVEHAEVLGVVVAVLRDLIPEPVPQTHLG
jgi:repressor LexA